MSDEEYNNFPPPGTPSALLAADIQEYADYHTVTLQNPARVKKGEYFSVIVKLTPGNGGSDFVAAVEDITSETEGNVNAAGISFDVSGSFFAMEDEIPEARDWKQGENLQEGIDGQRQVGDQTIAKEIRRCRSSVRAYSTTASTASPALGTNNPELPNSPSTTNSSSRGGCSTASGLAGLAAITLFILKRRSI